eukprot:COSAG02_NODE_13482_length_1389_cov_1.626357_2_plen_21_part_01
MFCVPGSDLNGWKLQQQQYGL